MGRNRPGGTAMLLTIIGAATVTGWLMRLILYLDRK